MAIWKRVEPGDILALVMVVGGYILILNGANGIASTTIAIVAGYYFGRKSHQYEQQNAKN